MNWSGHILLTSLGLLIERLKKKKKKKKKKMLEPYVKNNDILLIPFKLSQ